MCDLFDPGFGFYCSYRRPTCRGLCKKTKLRCQQSRYLNADGFCKYHVPDAPQCVGFAVTKGKRCERRWNLDSDQRCKCHALNAPQCVGIAATGERCKHWWDLDDNQLCEDHASQVVKKEDVKEEEGSTAETTSLDVIKTEVTSTAPEKKRRRIQCRGDAVTTGKRCCISKDLNNHQLCKFHVGQVVMCHGVGAATGERCGSTKCVDKRGFCPLHAKSSDGDEDVADDYDDDWAYEDVADDYYDDWALEAAAAAADAAWEVESGDMEPLEGEAEAWTPVEFEGEAESNASLHESAFTDDDGYSTDTSDP